MRRLHVIINPAAGQDEPVLAVLNRELGRAEIEWSHSVTQRDGDMSRMARQAVEDGHDVVAVYGGDGSVSAAADVIRTRAQLAILPGGTGNVVAGELGIPAGFQAAVRSLASGAWRPTDVDGLEIDGRLFLLRAGIGADARMIERADRDEKDRLGWAAYLHSALSEAWTGDIASYEVEIDGERHDFDAVTVVVANIGRIGRGGLRISGHVSPTDGQLDVFVLRRTDIPAWISIVSAFLGESDPMTSETEDPPLLHRTARDRVRVTARPVQAVHADGELLGETPKEITVAPAAARLLRPPQPE